MKSTEQILSEQFDALEAAGFSVVQITEATKPCKSIEEKLSAGKKLLESKGIKENSNGDWVPVKKIVRKNGYGVFAESGATTSDERVQRYMKEARVSFREASIIVTGTDPGKDVKFPSTVIESLKNKWRKSGAVLTETEITQLAERGVEP